MDKRRVEIVERREEHRRQVVENARRWASSLNIKSTAILIGSYARGDYNLWSDVDILLITDSLAGNVLERMESLDNPPGFQIVPLTRAEFSRLLRKKECTRGRGAYKGDSPKRRPTNDRQIKAYHIGAKYVLNDEEKKLFPKEIGLPLSFIRHTALPKKGTGLKLTSFSLAITRAQTEGKRSRVLTAPLPLFLNS